MPHEKGCRTVHASLRSPFCPDCGERIQPPTPREPGELRAKLAQLPGIVRRVPDPTVAMLVLTVANVVLNWALGYVSNERLDSTLGGEHTNPTTGRED